jgi:protein transport protein SEC24
MESVAITRGLKPDRQLRGQFTAPPVSRHASHDLNPELSRTLLPRPQSLRTNLSASTSSSPRATMSGFSMYHALGTGSPNPNAAGRPDEPNKWRPPVAASPAGYHQGGSPAVGQAPNRYPGTPQNNAPMQQESYFPQQGTPPVHSPYAQSPQQGDHDVSSVTSQMGAVGLGVEAYAQPRHKKKNRHAYHNIEGPGGSTPAFNGTPQGGTPTQFYGQPSPQVGGALPP